MDLLRKSPHRLLGMGGRAGRAPLARVEQPRGAYDPVRAPARGLRLPRRGDRCSGARPFAWRTNRHQGDRSSTGSGRAGGRPALGRRGPLVRDDLPRPCHSGGTFVHRPRRLPGSGDTPRLSALRFRLVLGPSRSRLGQGRPTPGCVHRPDFWKRLDIKVPTLLFHDAENKRIPLSDAEWLEQEWLSARLVVTHGLGHRGVLSDPSVIQEAVAFLQEGSAG